MIARCLLLTCLVAASSAQFTLARNRISSGVQSHAKLDLDVRDMGKALDRSQFGSADRLYSNGKNSFKSSGKRTLRGFSTDASKKLKGEGYFELYRKFWKSASYADKFVKSALSGKNDMKGKAPIFRAEAALKGAQFQNVWMYVIHEMEDAINDCVANNLMANDKGVTAWDEAWAFYAGSAVGARGKGDGFMLYTLADKRCQNFNTCSGGTAKVNRNILNLMKTGKRQLVSGQCTKVVQTKNAIVKQMSVPLAQGILRYVVLTKGATGSSLSKAHGEGWAFTAALLPLISRCDKNAGTRLRDNFKPKARVPMKDPIDVVAKSVYGTLGCLGIKCSDIGRLAGLPKCRTRGSFRPVPGTNAPSKK